VQRAPLKRVLLVEDDPDVRLVAALALTDLGGLTVEVCGSAREALEVGPGFGPDMILLDVMMPDMDGVAAFHAMRAHAALHATPVVFMTARAQPHEVARYRALGSLGVVTKPFEPETLADTLRGLWRDGG
jgi:CheY-like chemotaxis protein